MGATTAIFGPAAAAWVASVMMARRQIVRRRGIRGTLLFPHLCTAARPAVKAKDDPSVASAGAPPGCRARKTLENAVFRLTFFFILSMYPPFEEGR
jgi:hypothetical protein